MPARIADDELLEEIRRLAEQLGERPTADEMEERGEYSRTAYYNHFDSWDTALKKAGFEKGGHTPYSLTDEQLIEEINRMAENGDPPTVMELLENGKYDSKVYYDHFGSWNSALREAGYEPNHEKNVPRFTKSCEICGDDMELAEYESSRRFCSKECHGKYRSEKYTGKAHPRYVERVEVECSYCGEYFKREEWLANRNGADLCSMDCRKAWRSEIFNGSRHPRWVDRVTVECDNCGSDIEREKREVEQKDNFFCDKECLAEWLEKPDAVDRIDYGPGWNEEKKETVREKYDRTCQACGDSEEKHLEMYGARLSVHHILPADWFDNPEKRNAVSNLVPLCCVCHKQWEGIPLKPTLIQSE